MQRERTERYQKQHQPNLFSIHYMHMNRLRGKLRCVGGRDNTGVREREYRERGQLGRERERRGSEEESRETAGRETSRTHGRDRQQQLYKYVIWGLTRIPGLKTRFSVLFI